MVPHRYVRPPCCFDWSCALQVFWLPESRHIQSVLRPVRLSSNLVRLSTPGLQNPAVKTVMALVARTPNRRFSANGRRAKAILPELRSVRRAIPFQFERPAQQVDDMQDPGSAMALVSTIHRVSCSSLEPDTRVPTTKDIVYGPSRG
jgi:hypothetical protein